MEHFYFLDLRITSICYFHIFLGLRKILANVVPHNILGWTCKKILSDSVSRDEFPVILPEL